VKPGPGKDYRRHPTIKTFLEETSLDPLVSDKRQRMNYHGSSASISENSRASTLFGSGTLRCSDPLQVETIFRSENVAHRQEATLRSADVITFACAGPSGPASAASSTDVLLHSSKHIRRVMLDSWLDPAQTPQVAEEGDSDREVQFVHAQSHRPAVSGGVRAGRARSRQKAARRPGRPQWPLAQKVRPKDRI
jgi:hypothetical protein